MPWTQKLSTWFWNYRYGKGLYVVRFTWVTCNMKASLFGALCDIEQYGLALHTAQTFMKKQWVYTEKGTLVCESLRPNLMVLDAKIIVEDNLDFLAERHAQMIRDGYTIEVSIPSFGQHARVEPGIGPFPVTFVREIN